MVYLMGFRGTEGPRDSEQLLCRLTVGIRRVHAEVVM